MLHNVAVVRVSIMIGNGAFRPYRLAPVEQVLLQFAYGKKNQFRNSCICANEMIKWKRSNIRICQFHMAVIWVYTPYAMTRNNK